MRTLITHDDWGIYLGSFCGLGFWSSLDAVGQTFAVTFLSVEEAKEFVRTWESGSNTDDYKFIEIVAGEYVGILELREMGFDTGLMPVE